MSVCADSKALEKEDTMPMSQIQHGKGMCSRTQQVICGEEYARIQGLFNSTISHSISAYMLFITAVHYELGASNSFNLSLNNSTRNYKMILSILVIVAQTIK